MSFPSTLDTTSTIPVESSSTPLSTNHVANHTAMQTAIIAIETLLGITASAVTGTFNYILGEITGNDKAVGKTATQTLTNKTLTGPTITGATITNSTVNGVTLQTGGASTDYLAANGSYVAGSVTNASTTVKGIVELATESEMVSGTATGSTGAALVVTPDILYKRIKFGGNGSDGALNITSGTTTIDLASANFVTKNYTSINISSGATLAFSNPASSGTIIQLKSQGSVTIAGTLDASGTGTSGGATVTGTAVAGNAGTAVASSLLLIPGGATGGLAGAVAGNPAGGVPSSNPFFFLPTLNLLSSGIGRYIIPGTGGGSGSVGSSSGTSGIGGRGGAALYIECSGAWNFTGTINTSGLNGGNAVTAGAGGGGGGAGILLALYNTLTASSGTVTNNSGAGGSGTGGGNCGGGGGGASLLGNGGIAGNNSGAPASPSNGGGGGGGGGFGGITGGSSSTSSSLSLITLNSYFS